MDPRWLAITPALFACATRKDSIVAEASSFAPGGLAASNWLPGSYIKDVIELTAPPYMPPLAASLYI